MKINLEDVIKIFEQIKQLSIDNKKYKKALYQLACLGNGGQLGNSDGNKIAQKALGIEK